MTDYNTIRIKQDNNTFEIIRSIYDIFTISIDNINNIIFINEITLDLKEFKELIEQMKELIPK